MESDVCIQASVFFRHCLKKKKIPKMMVAQLPIKYKQEKKKSWQRNIRNYIKWGRKWAFSLCKSRIKPEAVPILPAIQKHPTPLRKWRTFAHGISQDNWTGVEGSWFEAGSWISPKLWSWIKHFSLSMKPSSLKKNAPGHWSIYKM